MLSKVTLQVPLAWLGALPEAVVRARKEGASDDDVIRFKIILKVPYYSFLRLRFWKSHLPFLCSLLGSNVDAESYEGEVCGETLANTRCYAQVGIQNANTSLANTILESSELDTLLDILDWNMPNTYYYILYLPLLTPTVTLLFGLYHMVFFRWPRWRMKIWILAVSKWTNYIERRSGVVGSKLVKGIF